jgi:hypothetical protein
MSKGIRRPGTKTPFETKRVIVAACASIAMVLGAMSAGASVTSTQEPTSQGEISSIVNDTAKKRATPASVSTGLTKKQTLDGRDFFQQPGNTLYKAPKQPNVIKNSIATVFNTATPTLLTQFVQAGAAVVTPETLPKAIENSPKDTTPAPSSEAPIETMPAPTPSSDTPVSQPEPTPELSTLSVGTQTSGDSSDEPLTPSN